MNRWVEQYSELSLRETVDIHATLNLITTFSVMDELDAEPITEELGKAIDAFSSGKAPSSDGIPPEVI